MIYRLEFQCLEWGSQGLEYFPDKASAINAARKYYKEKGDKEIESFMEYLECNLTEFETPKTKKAIIIMFNCYGSHPNNG